MATINISTPDFSLSSTWQCEKKAELRKTLAKDTIAQYATPNVKLYAFKMGPTWASRAVSFPVTLPSGAEVTSAKVFATCGNVFTGYSVLNVNGNQLKIQGGGVYAADVSLSGGTFSATFNFKANGNCADTDSHTVTMTFKDVYLQIEYSMKETPVEAENIAPDGLKSPAQGVCIYDPATGKIYMFDGVTKIQHQLTMKIEEEPSKKKDEYVNNARNEPDKITLEVVMSDVYYGESNLEDSAEISDAQSSAKNATKSSVNVEDSRSANAFAVLHALKEERQKLAVITPQFVYVDMIIASVTLNQDDSCPYGWIGQIVLQKAYEQKKKQETNSDAKTGGEQKPVAAGINWVKNFLSSGTSTQTSVETAKTLTVTTKDSQTRDFKLVNNSSSNKSGSKGG